MVRKLWWRLCAELVCMRQIIKHNYEFGGSNYDV